jgi:ribonuclease VapC
VIAVDRSALIAILRREPEAERFIDIIAAAHTCLLSSVGLLETSMVLAGRIAGSAAWARLDALIQDAGMTVVPHNAALAHAARDAFLRFGKGRHPAALNMGDCAAYALAKQANAPLLFKGNDFSRTDIVAAR